MTRHLYAGRYQSGDLVGSGTMSQVFRGRDQRLDSDVAIKVLQTDLAREPSFQARFRREAQNAASLNHPNIVAVLDTGETAGPGGTTIPFIVMEYVDGSTLRAALTTNGAMPPRRALEVAAEICAALDFSHRSGIVHRNVIPASVLLGRDGAVKVMEFGIARPMSGGQTTATTVIGTAHYLSPEQIRGHAGDAQSDIYALGCVLHEMLCGTPPFTGQSPVAIASRHVREAPEPPSRKMPGLPRDIDAIVLKALSKNPQNRYATAAEMRTDLQRALAGQSVRATPLLRPAPASVGAGSMSNGSMGNGSMGTAAGAGSMASATMIAGQGGGGTGAMLADPPISDAEPASDRPALLAPVRPVPAIPPSRDPTSDERTRRIWRRITLGVVAVAVVVAMWLTLSVVLAPPPPAKVAVPDLTGMTLEEATATLQDKHLALGTVVTVEVDDADPGTIANQRPSRLTQVDEGSPVNVQIDAG